MCCCLRRCFCRHRTPPRETIASTIVAPPPPSLNPPGPGNPANNVLSTPRLPLLPHQSAGNGEGPSRPTPGTLTPQQIKDSYPVYERARCLDPPPADTRCTRALREVLGRDTIRRAEDPGHDGCEASRSSSAVSFYRNDRHHVSWEEMSPCPLITCLRVLCCFLPAGSQSDSGSEGGGRSTSRVPRLRGGGDDDDDADGDEDDPGKDHDSAGKGQGDSSSGRDDSSGGKDDSASGNYDSASGKDDTNKDHDDARKSKEDTDKAQDDAGKSQDDTNRDQDPADAGRAQDDVDAESNQEDTGKGQEDAGRGQDDTNKDQEHADADRGQDGADRSRDDAANLEISRADPPPTPGPSSPTAERRRITFAGEPTVIYTPQAMEQELEESTEPSEQAADPPQAKSCCCGLFRWKSCIQIRNWRLVKWLCGLFRTAKSTSGQSTILVESPNANATSSQARNAASGQTGDGSRENPFTPTHIVGGPRLRGGDQFESDGEERSSSPTGPPRLRGGADGSESDEDSEAGETEDVGSDERQRTDKQQQSSRGNDATNGRGDNSQPVRSDSPAISTRTHDSVFVTLYFGLVALLVLALLSLERPTARSDTGGPSSRKTPSLLLLSSSTRSSSNTGYGSHVDDETNETDNGEAGEQQRTPEQQQSSRPSRRGDEHDAAEPPPHPQTPSSSPTLYPRLRRLTPPPQPLYPRLRRLTPPQQPLYPRLREQSPASQLPPVETRLNVSATFSRTPTTGSTPYVPPPSANAPSSTSETAVIPDGERRRLVVVVHTETTTTSSLHTETNMSGPDISSTVTIGNRPRASDPEPAMHAASSSLPSNVDDGGVRSTTTTATLTLRPQLSAPMASELPGTSRARGSGAAAHPDRPAIAASSSSSSSSSNAEQTGSTIATTPPSPYHVQQTGASDEVPPPSAPPAHGFGAAPPRNQAPPPGAAVSGETDVSVERGRRRRRRRRRRGHTQFWNQPR
ncbi:hypothetical protein GTA08_BOTSDO05939 [Botryosphaeria dothidea]|uniref:Uncharacterized protein n=1 Tax=Botryosphaeria dothidea TaxID=55169 RepID=A0A8H4IX05_9PEZI|nr:hypothetical protein GTA08_BOTSDO05939 [Botryosphaeria dothidea]